VTPAPTPPTPAPTPAGTTALRDTGRAAYTDGTGTFHPLERRLVEGRSLAGETIITVDACVIGSGAGGAPVAKELAEGGMRVAILEDGDWHEASTFTARPREMTHRLYRDAGQLVTVGVPPIPLPLGKAIGGTTLVNSGTCFRTPPHILEQWRDEFGLRDLTLQAMDPFFRRVEREINVTRVPEELAGSSARLVLDGAARLGLSGGHLFRNAKGCVGSGVCAFGCPAGAKQHTGVTYIPRAWAAGATTYTGVRAQRVKHENGRVTEVVAKTAGGGTLRVRCTHAIVACGTLLTPALLKASGVRSGELGRNLSIHPASAARALFDEDLDPWTGVPQSAYIDALQHEGIMFEGISGPPDQAAMSTPRTGAAHRDLMLQARRTASFGVMVHDTGRGSVHRRLGQTIVRYDLHADDAARFQRGLIVLAQVFFAAGAREVVVPLAGVPTLKDGDTTPLEQARIRPRHVSAMAFHPLGTARAGADPAESVVDPDLQVHGIRGLYVSDGSVVPSSLGVNPQITIMALATRLAYGLLGQPAPEHEPHPTAIA
jgi:choline dehydrogenase-like flavoprotein